MKQESNVGKCLRIVESTPTSLVLTRQNLPVLDVPEDVVEEGVRKGAYTVYGSEETPEFLLLASVRRLVQLKLLKILKNKVNQCVLFQCLTGMHLNNNEEYKESVIPSSVTNAVAIEMASPLGWHKYVGTAGKVIAIDGFGASAPGDLVSLKNMDFTKENILNQVMSL
ncbi:transketolase-like TK C-terminal-containing protein [Staphylococcus aureus]